MADNDPWAADPAFLAEVAVAHFERRKSQTEIVNAMPLYPTESILWDANQVPEVHYTGGMPPCAGPTCDACCACKIPHRSSVTQQIAHEAASARAAGLSA